MSRCMNNAQTEFLCLASAAVFQYVIRLEGLILVPALWRLPAIQFGAGCRGQQRRCRRMIRVCVGNENPLDWTIGKCLDGVDMFWYSRSGIDHGDFFTAQQIGIGARTRHHRWIRRKQPPHTGCELGDLSNLKTHRSTFLD